MGNIDNNDDVFNDGPEEGSGDGAAKQPSNFSRYDDLSSEGIEIPGYLREALEKYIHQHGFSGRNKRLPYSAAVISEISSIVKQIYRQDSCSNAVAAIWQVLDEATEGAVTAKFQQIQLEEKIQTYDYLSSFVNRIFVEIQEYAEQEGYEETTRLARMILVYFDLLSYHHQWYLEEYYEFCQQHEMEPKPAVVEGRGWDHDHPWLLNNVVLYRLDNPENNALKSSLTEFFNEIVTGVSEFIKNQVTHHDRSSLEKE